MKKICIRRSKNILKKTLKKIFWIILFLTTIYAVYAANSLQFTEIMYNPQGSDTGREWIELSNSECENLERYKLLENNINHNIMLYSEGACDYAIICDDCSRFLDDYNVSSALYESSFTLSNTGELIAITYNGTIIDYVNYTDMDSIEGMSIKLYDGYWTHSVPTPGHQIMMNISANQTLNQSDNQTMNNITLNQTANQTINFTINQTMNITANDTMNNSTHNNTSNMTITNSTGNEERCDVTIGMEIKGEKDIYYNKEAIKFYNILNVTPAQKAEFYIEYWVEDIYGNMLKSRVQTNNLNEKTYTPSTDERTVAAVFKNRIINLTCEYMEENFLNETAEKTIIIKNPEFKEEECEKCEKCDQYSEIEQQSQLKARIEDDTLKIEAYRGNDRKYVISTVIKNSKGRNVMAPIKISLEKYSGIIIDIPIEIEDCGQYRVMTEGLGIIEESEYIVGCEDTSEERLKNEEEKKTDKNIVTAESSEKGSVNRQKAENNTENISQFFHNSITGKVIYESRNEETRKYSLIGMLFIISGSAIYTTYKLFIAKKNAPKDL